MERTVTAVSIKLTLTPDGVHANEEFAGDERILAIAFYALQKDIKNDERVKRAWTRAQKLKEPAGMN